MVKWHRSHTSHRLSRYTVSAWSHRFVFIPVVRFKDAFASDTLPDKTNNPAKNNHTESWMVQTVCGGTTCSMCMKMIIGRIYT